MASNFYIDEIVKNITLELHTQITKLYDRAIKNTTKRVKKIVKQEIKNSPEYNEFISDTVFHQLGIPDILDRVDVIIDKIVEGIEVVGDINPRVDLKRGIIKASVEIRILDLSYRKILSLPEAKFITEKSEVLQWLGWLLFFGDAPVVLEYFYFDEDSPGSRTGHGFMGQANSGVWSVPPEISGTQNNNWLTRSLDSLEGELEGIIKEEFADLIK